MNTSTLQIKPRIIAPLDPGFVPAALWNRAYRDAVARDSGRTRLSLGLQRPNGVRFVLQTEVLPHVGAARDLNRRYLDRLVKFLLWQKGGSRVQLAGDPQLVELLAEMYSPSGERAFDAHFMGQRIFAESFEVEAVGEDELKAKGSPGVALGRHLDGCRIGFDLGGSDRKAAALIDGKVVFSEEIEWDPYFQNDVQYHYEGIQDSLKRAAEKLPRVDAIGGSAAGVYIDNKVRVGSLFRGIAEDNFEAEVSGLFLKIQQEWGGIPFDVVNDGEVTALAGSMAMNDNAVLGLSMGTSTAGGFVDSNGAITSWLNELAFTPVDYRDDAPEDEWSKDRGCGVQYFSQQAVGRLIPAAGIDVAAGTPLPEQLRVVQDLMAREDDRARAIYETIGVYLGYELGHYAEQYSFRNLLLLGRVTSGEGGEIIKARAHEVLQAEFPELANLNFHSPDEQEKRHGQAVAAASLPASSKTAE